MPTKKKKTVRRSPTISNMNIGEVFISSSSSPPKKKGKSREVILFQSLLRERQQCIESWQLQSTEQVSGFVQYQGFNAQHMSSEQLSLMFQWLLHKQGLHTQRQWREDIQVQIPTGYLPAALQSLGFFHNKMPEEVSVIDATKVAIATPGFDTLYDPSTPENKIYSPTKIQQIKDHIVNMGDDNRIELSEQLRKNDMEIFRWGEEGAVPFRKTVPIPNNQRRPRKTW